MHSLKYFSNILVKKLANSGNGCFNDTQGSTEDIKIYRKGKNAGMKKMYSKPMVEELSIKETAAGGSRATTHDGYIYEMNVNGNQVFVEEYYPASGENA